MSCIICNKTISSVGDSDTVCVKKKGLETLCRFSELRGDNLFHNDMDEVTLHTKCRKRYTKENAKGIYFPLDAVHVSENLSSSAGAGASTSTSSFPFKEQCLFCAQHLDEDKENRIPSKKRLQVFQVSRVDTKQNIIKNLKNTPTSNNEMILRRIEEIDLVAAQARYHKKCYLDVVHGKQYLKRGRPESNDVSSAMEIIYDHIEKSDDCQFSVKELKELLSDYVPDERTIIRKLSDKFGQRLIITEQPGRSPILTLRDSIDDILKEIWYNQRSQDDETERKRIVKKAAEIIREDIRLKTYDNNAYPSPNDFLKNADQDVPETLKIFLQTLTGKRSESEDVYRKLISIAHAIIAVLRPRKFISCILLALAVTMKKKYGSKALVTVLNRLGFSATYQEANTLEVSCVNIRENTQKTEGFHQFIFDNADANINTIDGKNTFHAMGGLQCTTPIPKNTLDDGLPRIEKALSADIVGSFGNIPLEHYNRQKNGLRNIIVEDYPAGKKILPTISDIMWLYGKINDIPETPGWCGFMQKLTAKQPFEVSGVKALPFVNAPPSNLDTINTVLTLAAQKTLQNGQTTTFVTFDQPLYAKARDLVAEASERHDPLLKSVVVRLGGFHLLMSFMGGIGYIMAGSGLKELWSTIYAPNSVIHMLGGHAYARSIRANMLTYLALAGYVIQEMNMTDIELAEVEHTLHTINYGLSINDLDNETFNTIQNKFDDAMCQLESRNPTAKKVV